jgi:glycosyltransferase involved in cell wall biosynthesis
MYKQEEGETNMPAISVIIPLFNQEALVEKTMDSLVSQGFRDFEIILVDDASTDRSVEIAERVLGKSGLRWTLIRSTSNRGASETRNTGLDRASGKGVFFLDGDDRLSPEALGSLWVTMTETGSPIAFCGFRVSPENGSEGKAYSMKLPAGRRKIGSIELMKAYLKGKRYLNASNVLYDLAFLKEKGIRFPRGCRFAEDREFILKACFQAGTVGVLPEPLATYIQHSGQSTSRMGNNPVKYAHEAAVYLRLRKYLQECGAAPHLVRLIETVEIPGAVVKMATSAVRSGREDLFWRYVRSGKMVELARRGAGSWHIKPEVAFKSMLFSFAPALLLRLYRRKA